MISSPKDSQMSNLHYNYTKIINLLHGIEPNFYFSNQKIKPKLNDIELIALNLALYPLNRY